MNHLEDCLIPCLESIKKHVNLDDKEVIIAANGCTDGTREYVESLGDPFKLLWWDDPKGFAIPNNEAAKIAKGEYILFLNNDVFFTASSGIDLLLAELKKDSKLGIVGAQLRHNMETDRDFVIFFCAMMRKKLFEDFGYFDEIFLDGTCEDVDLCIKVANAGYGLKAIPVPVVHKGGTTITQMSNMMEKLNRNALILGKKWDSKWYKENFPTKKVSIIIPTYNHLDDLLRPCLESVIKYCNLEDKEVLVVANGCTDGTREYVESLGDPFKLLWYDEPIGYAKANNEALKIILGEYVLLLNNDAILLDQQKDTLINMLLQTFANDPAIGIVGPKIITSEEAGNRDFVIFFCAMIKREVFKKIGLLDESFGMGSGEDIDFCIRAEEEGYLVVEAGERSYNGNPYSHDGKSTNLPLFHAGEGTVHDINLVKNFNDIYLNNMEILRKRYNRKKVLCCIPTKGRYFTTLPLVIQSVISQTVKPDKVILYDDGEHRDLRQVPLYQYIFKTLDDSKIKWGVEFTQGRGQHFAHQLANTSKFELIWRLDDDTIAMPNVLEKLLQHMKDEKVGAVAGSVIMPGGEILSEEYALTLVDINRRPNIQWAKGNDIIEVEHLYSSFLYRSNIVDYNLDLSSVAHREETIFSHRLFRAGYKLLVDRSAVTYHYRNPEGGIRTETDTTLWQQDEEIFRKELEKWGYRFIALSHGLGDHLAFVNILPKIMKKCEKLVLFCAYGEVFDDINNVIARPLAEAETFGCKEISTYEWMTRYNWKRSIVEAYEKIYLD
jgi:GT2 family glycosyltransferase